MRWVFVILGILLALMGGVWFFQGIGTLLGSPMTNQPFWAVAGAVVALVGVLLLVMGLRRRPSQGGKTQ